MAELVRMLALSPTMEVGTISTWHLAEGDEVKPGAILCEVETDKANMDYETDSKGTLLKILVAAGDGAAVGDPIAIIGHPDDKIDSLLKEAKKKPTATLAEKTEVSPVEKPGESAPAADSGGPVKASPVARHLAAEKGISLGSIKGSGPGGRIVKKDVIGIPAVAVSPPGPETVQAAPGDLELPVSGMRKIIAQRLIESKFSAPHYYVTMSIIADNIIEVRRQYNREHQEAKISLNAVLMKLAAEALKRHPRVNVTWAGDKIIQHGSIDIGLAVAMEEGLITPVVRNCGGKGIKAIEAELGDLIPRARELKLKPEEYQNATFTMSNLGMFGVDSFTAVINPPGSAIMALGAALRQPVVNERDEIVVKSVMKATLSCDHRVVDGAVGAAFMKEFKKLVEEPLRILL